MQYEEIDIELPILNRDFPILISRSRFYFPRFSILNRGLGLLHIWYLVTMISYHLVIMMSYHYVTFEYMLQVAFVTQSWGIQPEPVCIRITHLVGTATAPFPPRRPPGSDR